MMEISKFLANYYIWFIVFDVLLLFGLIGYIIDSKNKSKIASKTEVLETIKFDNVDDLKNQIGDKGNDSLNSVVNGNTETLDILKNEETSSKEKESEDEVETL